MTIGENHALPDKFVDVRGLESTHSFVECRDRVVAHVIGENQDDVREFLRFGADDCRQSEDCGRQDELANHGFAYSGTFPKGRILSMMIHSTGIHV